MCWWCKSSWRRSALTLQCRSLITGWRPAPTRTTSCAGKWRLWSAPTRRNFSFHPFTLSPSPHLQTLKKKYLSWYFVYEPLVSSPLQEVSYLCSGLCVKKSCISFDCFPGLKPCAKQKTKIKIILNFILFSNQIIYMVGFCIFIIRNLYKVMV